MEDKRGFVNDVLEALIKHGDGRYSWLMDSPVRYMDEDDSLPEGVECVVGRSGARYNVTGESLTSLLGVIKHIVE